MAFPNTILHKNMNNMIIEEAKIWVKFHTKGKISLSCKKEETTHWKQLSKSINKCKQHEQII